MPMFTRGCIVLLLILVSACTGNSTTTPSATPAPTATPTPAATTFSLSGTVTDSTTGLGISGATVTVADGVNIGKSTTTTGTGSYAFAALQLSGFTVNISATGYLPSSTSVTLTSNQTLSVSLAVGKVPVTFVLAGAPFTFPVAGQTVTTEGASTLNLTPGDYQVSGSYTSGAMAILFAGGGKGGVRSGSVGIQAANPQVGACFASWGDGGQRQASFTITFTVTTDTLSACQ